MTRTEFLMADGVRIVGDVGGDPAGPTVALMHGGGQTRHSWSGAMQALVAAGYHVVNYDARGHGESDWSVDGDYTSTRHARDLGDVLRGMPAPVALVGASMGGATALYAVGEDVRPRASALVFVDIVPVPNPKGTERIRAFMSGNPDGFATLDDVAEAIAAYNPHRPRPEGTAGLVKNLRWRDGRWFWHWDPRILDEGNGRIAAARMTEYARMITVPALLVRGMSSDVVDDEGVVAFRRDVPKLEIFDVPGAGHMVAGDRNDAFNGGILQFLLHHLSRGE